MLNWGKCLPIKYMILFPKILFFYSLPVSKLEYFPDGVEDRVESEVEPYQPQQVVGNGHNFYLEKSFLVHALFLLKCMKVVGYMPSSHQEFTTPLHALYPIIGLLLGCERKTQRSHHRRGTRFNACYIWIQHCNLMPYNNVGYYIFIIGIILKEDFWTPRPSPPYRIDFAKNWRKSEIRTRTLVL